MQLLCAYYLLCVRNFRKWATSEDMILTSPLRLELFIFGLNVRIYSLSTCIGPTDDQTVRYLRFLAGEGAVAGGSIIRNIVSQDTAALEDQLERCIDPAR